MDANFFKKENAQKVVLVGDSHAEALEFHLNEEIKKNDFSDFAMSWSEFDLYNGQQVSVKTSSGVIEGLAQGISSKGKLLVQNTKGLHHISTGSVRKLNSEKITC